MTTISPTGLNPETARRLFGEMEADADFGLIETCYHPDLRFRRRIQALEGRAAFVEMSRRLVDRCGELRTHVNDARPDGAHHPAPVDHGAEARVCSPGPSQPELREHPSCGARTCVS